MVAIDGTNVPAAGKPVLQRTVRAVPGGRPAVARVLAQRAGQDPVEGPVPSDSAIVVEGANLAASAVWGQFGDTVVAADTVHDDRVLLHAPETLPAGVYPLRIRQDVQAGPATTMARVLESNAVAFVRQPRVVSATPDASGPAVEVQLDVPVADRARVRLLLDELDVPAGATARGYEFDAPFPLTGRADPHTVRVAVAGVVPGRYLVRVDADGAQSPLEQDASGRFSGPVIDLSGLRP